MNGLALRMGWRFYRDRQANPAIRFISLASTLGIMIGVAALIIVLSAMNGFESELKERFLDITSHAQVKAYERTLEHWPKLVEKAESIDGITAAAPEISMKALVQDGLSFQGLELIGINTSYEAKINQLKSYMSAAAWASLIEKKNAVVLGQGLAHKLGLSVGDTLVLYVPTPETNLQSMPKVVPFEVTGVFQMHGQMDYTRAYTSLRTANTILGTPDGATTLKLKVEDIFQAPLLVRQLGSQMQQPAYLSDWTHQREYNDIQLVRLIMFVVLFLVIGVACFNIVSTLVMSVREKKGEIAILLTMGMTPKSIGKVFMIQGGINGMIGVILGTFLGCLVADNLTLLMQTIEVLTGTQFLTPDIYFIDFIPSEIRFFEVCVLMCLACVMCLIATVYPAYKASQIAPARALCHLV